MNTEQLTNLLSYPSAFVLRSIINWNLAAAQRLLESGVVSISGLEQTIEIAREYPTIIAPNHIIPKNTSKATSMDAFLLMALFLQYGMQLQTAAKYDDGIETPGKFTTQFRAPLQLKTYEKVGFIPVPHNKGASVWPFIQHAGNCLDEGNPVLIFPQGVWSKEWDPNLPIQDGLGMFCKFYLRRRLETELKIVPTCIRHHEPLWTIAFGNPIQVSAQTLQTGSSTPKSIATGITQEISRLASEREG